MINLLGDNIRKLRLEKGLGLNEVARLANITGGYLSSIENNKRTNVGTEILESIAKAIGVSVSDFYLQNEKIINENEEEFNSDIVRIERARRKMPKDERENMMKVLEAAFAKYFND
nr:MAG TPA: helix-turn-helix domain protein [Caudoviricetes sp.]